MGETWRAVLQLVITSTKFCLRPLGPRVGLLNTLMKEGHRQSPWLFAEVSYVCWLELCKFSSPSHLASISLLQSLLHKTANVLDIKMGRDLEGDGGYWLGLFQ